MYTQHQEHIIYDTYAYYKGLINSGIPEEQAECVVSILVDMCTAKLKTEREFLANRANERELALDNND